jgi:hypothetical protein
MIGLDIFLNAYVDAAMEENDESTPSGGVPLSRNHSRADIDPSTLEKMRADCLAFMEKAGEVIDMDLEEAGCDFYLSRNGHGAGFFDGDWDHLGEKVGDTLQSIAESLGEYHLYIGDDQIIYGA